MAGYVVVSPTPYFGQTDPSGAFTIDNLPDGKYNLVTWHEGKKQQIKSVNVSGTARVNFELEN
jgi:hypothetical protein